MQDLAGHHAPIVEALEAAFRRVLLSGRYIAPGDGTGEVASFEREAAAALGVAHAIGMSSGTDALLAMLMAAGVGPGDEVVTTPFSFVASADVIARLGARPRFVDIDPLTLNLDPARVAEALAAQTKAVLLVHLFGRMVDGADLRASCARRGVALLEDAAQALGATDWDGRRVGTLGRAAALSFFPTKNLGALGDAGMVLTDDEAFARKLRALRVHGASARSRYDIVGGNFRLDELHAALLRVKLPHVARSTEARRAVARRYGDALAGLPVHLPPPAPGMVWNQFVLRVPDGRRDALAAHLAVHGIATEIYYPRPLHLQPCFAALGHRPGDFPVAERACAEVLALPIYPELRAEDIDGVIAAIGDFFATSGR
jgi:dTDP-4-amino-4,6-dideoxygalactose transaminase